MMHLILTFAAVLPMATAGSAIKVAAISVATMEGNTASNWERGLLLAQTALGVGTPGLNRSDVELVLLPEAFAVGYPACDAHGRNCDLLGKAENRTTSKRLKAFRDLSASSGAMIIMGFIEHVPRSKGHNYFNQSVQNGVVIYDRGEEVGVHYKTWIAGCATPPPANCRPWRDETRLLVQGSGVEAWDTRLGRFAIYTCSENMKAGGWNKHKGAIDFVLSPYNCEDSGSEGGKFPKASFPPTPGEGLVGSFPQPTCETYRNNPYLSKKFGYPSVWTNRVGTVYEGTHFITNLGTAGVTDDKGNVVASSRPGVETILTATLSF